MSYYSTCPDCGAHLDPGEKCNCREEAESELLALVRKSKDPEMALQIAVKTLKQFLEVSKK